MNTWQYPTFVERLQSDPVAMLAMLALSAVALVTLVGIIFAARSMRGHRRTLAILACCCMGAFFVVVIERTNDQARIQQDIATRTALALWVKYHEGKLAALSASNWYSRAEYRSLASVDCSNGGLRGLQADELEQRRNEYLKLEGFAVRDAKTVLLEYNAQGAIHGNKIPWSPRN